MSRDRYQPSLGDLRFVVHMMACTMEHTMVRTMEHTIFTNHGGSAVSAEYQDATGVDDGDHTRATIEPRGGVGR